MPVSQNEQQGTTYRINREGHCLRIVKKNISPCDIDAVAAGTIHLALYEDGPFLFLLYRIKDAEWVDVPFSWHKLGDEEKVFLEEDTISPFEYIFRIVLADASLGAAAAREFTMDKAFAEKLHCILFRQAQSLFNPHSFMKHLMAIYNNLDVSDMVKSAQAHFKVD